MTEEEKQRRAEEQTADVALIRKKNLPPVRRQDLLRLLQITWPEDYEDEEN